MNNALKIGSRVVVVDGGARPCLAGMAGVVTGSYSTRLGEFYPEGGVNVLLDSAPSDGLGAHPKGFLPADIALAS